MKAVPKVDLTDPSVEPTDEELHALMLAVQESVIASKKAAHAAFRRQMDRAIYGRDGVPPPASDDVHDTDR